MVLWDSTKRNGISFGGLNVGVIMPLSSVRIRLHNCVLDSDDYINHGVFFSVFSKMQKKKNHLISYQLFSSSSLEYNCQDCLSFNL